MSRETLLVSVAALLAAAFYYVRVTEHDAAPYCAAMLPDEDPLRSIRDVANADGQAEPVLLGASGLLAGIPGEGLLTLDEVRDWLEDPANHRVLKPELPQGMGAGVADVKGLGENPLTRAKIELGRQLYFDPRLSHDGTVSCASCHEPDHGYAAATRRGVGVGGQQGARNSPTAGNRILSLAQFWDGRSSSLEEQAIGPIANPIEMGGTHDQVVETLRQIPAYALQFRTLFDDGVSIENVGKALASFERALVSGSSPWDLHKRLTLLQENFDEEDDELLAEISDLERRLAEAPFSNAAQRGAELFYSAEVGCSQCHAGANFSDERYHNLGVGLEAVDDGTIDWGRYTVTGDDRDRGAFKTPSLRNVAETAPYLHDGSAETLEEVIALYVEGGRPNPHLSPLISPLDLSDEEQADLVAFLRSLTGAWPEVERARLPEQARLR